MIAGPSKKVGNPLKGWDLWVCMGDDVTGAWPR